MNAFHQTEDITAVLASVRAVCAGVCDLCVYVCVCGEEKECNGCLRENERM